MHRRRSERMFAAIIGLWVLFIVSGLVPVHGCAVHDETHHVSMAGSMHHGGHESGQHSHEPKPCTCMGTCCAVAALTLPAGRLVALPVVPVTLVAITLEATPRVAPPAAPNVLLPPSLGPPGIYV